MENKIIGLVLRFDFLFPFFVFLGMCLCVGLHLLDFLLGQAAGRSDANALFLVRRLVLCRDVQHAVCIDVEYHFDLGNAAWCRRNPIEMETSQRSVIHRHWSLTLQDMNLY